MKRFYSFVAAAAVAVTGAFAATPQMAPILKKLDPSKIAVSPKFASDSPARIPDELGGNFSSWEFLAEGTFNAEKGLATSERVEVYYCTTDPFGWGVDTWCIEGAFPAMIRVAGMPFIDYYNISNFDTGLTYEGKPIMVDEFTTHYELEGIETMVYPELGRIEMAMLYYVDDPDVIDNVLAYGIETIQLDGEYFDYNVSMGIAGETVDGSSLKVDVNFADATNVKTAVYLKDSSYDPIADENFQALVAAQREAADATASEEAGSVYFPLGESGRYVVVTTYDTDGQSDDNYLVDTYDYETEWSDWGTAEYTDDYLSSYYDEFPILTVNNVRVQRHTSEERYRMVNPYTTDDTWTSQWSRLRPADPEVNSYMEINAVNPEKTYVVIAPIDITDGDGVRLVMGSAAHYNIINGRTDEAITEKGYWGTTTYSDDNHTVSVSFPRMVLMMRQITSPYPLFAGINESFKLIMKSSESTGIDGVAVDNDEAPAVFFDLQGRIVADPTENGIYIRRQGSKVEKVVVR